MRRLTPLCALLCALTFGAASAAPPPPAEPARGPEPAPLEGLSEAAQAAYDAAWRAMTAGDLEGALEHLDQAIALHPLPVLVYNHGRVQERMGDSRGAYEAYLKVQASPEASPSLKKLAERRARALAPLVQPAAPPGHDAATEGSISPVWRGRRFVAETPLPRGVSPAKRPVTQLREPFDPGPWPALLATAGTVVGFAGAWMLWEAEAKRDAARNSGHQFEVRTNDLTQAEAYRLRDEANVLAPVGAGTALVGVAAVIAGVAWWSWSGVDRLEPAASIGSTTTLGLRLRL